MDGQRSSEAGAATIAIRMRYRGEERTTELPLTQDMIGRLALEAAFRNVQIGELIGELIVGLLKEDLLQTMLRRSNPTKETAAAKRPSWPAGGPGDTSGPGTLPWASGLGGRAGTKRDPAQPSSNATNR